MPLPAVMALPIAVPFTTKLSENETFRKLRVHSNSDPFAVERPRKSWPDALIATLRLCKLAKLTPDCFSTLAKQSSLRNHTACLYMAGFGGVDCEDRHITLTTLRPVLQAKRGRLRLVVLEVCLSLITGKRPGTCGLTCSQSV